MKIYVELLLLAWVVVFIIDLSGIVESIKAALGRWLGGKIRPLRPFDCSLCMVWWCGLGYALLTHQLTLGVVAYIALLSYASMSMRAFAEVSAELVDALIARLGKFVTKITKRC